MFTSEMLPKIFAKRFSPFYLKAMAPVLLVSEKIFLPFNLLLVRSTFFKQRRFTKKKNISMNELSNALELTESAISNEKDILKGIVKFGDIFVKEILTSRVDVVAADITSDFNQLIQLIIDSGYSRIPVYENNFDNIKGILYIKDLLPHLNKPIDFKWQKLIRPPYFVPETKKIDDLLKEFQKNKIHLAIVVDEYGGSSGIITLEDILEEIVGEITDETDEDEAVFSRIDAENYIFEGKVYLNDFSKILNIDEGILDPIRGDADTLAGLILEMKGEIPRKNDKIKYGDFEFKVISVDVRRIKKIQVTFKNKTQ
ncbi:MAG: gliding motility-associated protein GldE [Bacteroidales bacterium]|nr:gliding motility-associated protein GldE [Bacteroidales bacterium]